MKAILTLVSLATLFLTGCVSGGSYSTGGYTTGRSYSAFVSSGYSYPTRPYQYQYSYSTRPHQYQQRTYFVGPQYYKTYDNRCGNIEYKNYTDAPVVVKRPYGSSIIVPKSWD